MDSYKDYAWQISWRIPENITKVSIKCNNGPFFCGGDFDDLFVSDMGKTGFMDAYDIMSRFSEVGYNLGE